MKTQMTLNERLTVAENPHTSPETLTALADDIKWYVREAVAQNTNTSSEILSALADDVDDDVRKAVADAAKMELKERRRFSKAL